MINNKLDSDYSHYTIIPIIPIIPIIYNNCKFNFLASWGSVCVINLIFKSPNRGLLYASLSDAVAHDFLCLTVDPSLSMTGGDLELWCTCCHHWQPAWATAPVHRYFDDHRIEERDDDDRDLTWVDEVEDKAGIIDDNLCQHWTLYNLDLVN